MFFETFLPLNIGLKSVIFIGIIPSIIFNKKSNN